MSEVQEAVSRGEYQRGVAVFRALSSPTPLELRWAGVCLMHEGKLPEACLRLREATTQGDTAAGVYLSALHILNGNVSAALAALEALDPASLPHDEAALWYRERALVGWLLGDHRDTLLALAEHAWERAASASGCTQVSAAILIGKLLGHFGEYDRALAYLDFAAEHGHPRQLEEAALARAASLTVLERFDEAQQQLDSIHSAALVLLRDIQHLCLLSARQDWLAARAALLALLPRTADAPAQELRVRTALLELATAEQDDVQARCYLLRAEALATFPYERFLLDHRAGRWLCLRGQVDEGLIRLRRAAEGLQQSGHLADAVAALLTLADAQPEQQDTHLHQAASLASELGTPPLLTAEWLMLPRIHQVLLAQPSTAFERSVLLGQAPAPVVRLLTLGRAELRMAEGQVRFRMARTIEILSYFARHKEASLEDVRRDLFPDTSPSTAKNYFHQGRMEIAARIPGLEIRFDDLKKRYRLQGRVKLVWDVEELEEALRGGCWPQTLTGSAEFLPSADSDWAHQERERLSVWAMQIGVETLHVWLQAGRYQDCLALAEQLQPLDPFGERLHVVMLQATQRMNGPLAAERLCHQIAETFTEEVGEIPTSLRKIAAQWGVLS